MRSLRVTALVAVAVVASACFVGPIDDPGTGPGGVEPANPVVLGTHASRDDGTMTVDEFQRDTAGAVEIAERYWDDKFSAAGQTFQPITQILPYQRTGELSCGGQELPINNAFYCTPGDFIAYDINWALASFRQIGDAFIFYLLGHEYAHGVQARLGYTYEYSIQQELQADCMAGAYIGGSVLSGTLALDDGDLDELRAGLISVADEPNQPWFSETAHGTAEQRIESFFTGYERSLVACDLT